MGAVPFSPRGSRPTAPVFPQVNNENVVKVGHRQVVNMIRQGGNHLVLKVVTVTRNLDPDDTARKKGARPALPLRSSLLCLDTLRCPPHLLPLGGQPSRRGSSRKGRCLWACVRTQVAARTAVLSSEGLGGVRTHTKPTALP